MFFKENNLNLKWLRRIVQILFFLLWYWLFFRAYVISGTIINGKIPYDFFLKIDPLAGILSSVAARAFSQEIIWWLPTVILTIIFGRFFCGWICALGTWLDIFDHFVVRWHKIIKEPKLFLKKNRKRNFRRLMTLKYYILIVFVLSALFSMSLFGYFDPLCIMERAFAFAIKPLFAHVEYSLINKNSIFGYALTKQHFYTFNIISFSLLISITLLNLRKRRHWCRILCPLGALLGAISKISFLKLFIDKNKCTSCLKCVSECKMGAIDYPEDLKEPVEGYSKKECIQCYLCVDACPEGCMSIKPNLKFWELADKPQEITDNGTPILGRNHNNLSRRDACKALLAGCVTAPLIKGELKTQKGESRRMIRPPFARSNEAEFLDLCIRCGMCIAVCKVNTLQATYFEAGIEGFMTPVLRPEIEGCSPSCSACGEVCPTNAIVSFKPEEKYGIKMGSARLELDRCISYTYNKDCNECVKHCPSLAIKVIKDKGLYKPSVVVTAECNGCGICERICTKIVANDSAIIVTDKGRGQPSDILTVLKNRKIKKEKGKNYLPLETIK